MSTKPWAKCAALTLIATTVAFAVSGTAPAATKTTKTSPTTKPAATTKPPATTPTTAKTIAAVTTLAPKPAAPSGKIGDQLTVAIPAAPNSLNPALANVGTANLVIRLFAF